MREARGRVTRGAPAQSHDMPSLVYLSIYLLRIDSSTEIVTMRPNASNPSAENGAGTNECGQFSSRKGRTRARQSDR